MPELTPLVEVSSPLLQQEVVDLGDLGNNLVAASIKVDVEEPHPLHQDVSPHRLGALGQLQVDSVPLRVAQESAELLIVDLVGDE